MYYCFYRLREFNLARLINSALQQRYFRLLERWPLDHSKPGRDLGGYIRLRLSAALTDSGPTSTDLRVNSSLVVPNFCY